MRRLDGERGEPSRTVGQRFVGVNRVWVPWATVCRIVAADEDAGRFAFDVDFGPFPVATWAYELAELPDGRVRVTERWRDRREGLRGAVMRPAGLLVGRGRDAVARNRATMRATLAALRADLSPAPADRPGWGQTHHRVRTTAAATPSAPTCRPYRAPAAAAGSAYP